MGNTLPHYWTIEEVASAVLPRVATSTVTRWCQSGKLKAYQVGRVWLIPDEEAERFIAEQKARWR